MDSNGGTGFPARGYSAPPASSSTNAAAGADVTNQITRRKRPTCRFTPGGRPLRFYLKAMSTAPFRLRTLVVLLTGISLMTCPAPAGWFGRDSSEDERQAV